MPEVPEEGFFKRNGLFKDLIMKLYGLGREHFGFKEFEFEFEIVWFEEWHTFAVDKGFDINEHLINQSFFHKLTYGFRAANYDGSFTTTSI